jgi:hypothetical protein
MPKVSRSQHEVNVLEDFAYLSSSHAFAPCLALRLPEHTALYEQR